jgi:MFS family permease
MSQPNSLPSPAAHEVAATRVRYLVVAMCIAMSVLLYIDRFALSPATDTIRAELKVSKTEFAEAVKAFFLAYALMQIPAGWLTDTLGARRTLTIYVVGWSLATIGLGLVRGLADISLARMLMGILQAGAYPAAAGLLKHWIPFGGRGGANSSVAMGGRLGGLFAFAFTEPLMLLAGRITGWETGRWQLVFMFFGALGLVWAAAFVWLYRDSPEEHPWCNDAERRLISGGNQVEASGGAANLWPICLGYFLVNIGWIVLVSWLPRWIVAWQGPALAGFFSGEKVAVGLLEALAMLVGLVGTLALGLATNRVMYGVVGRTAQRYALPLADMARSKEVWLMCVINFTVNVGWIFLVTWLPQYLVETRGEAIHETVRSTIGQTGSEPAITALSAESEKANTQRIVAGLLTAATGLAGMLGSVLGGMATDRFVRRFGRAWGRRLPGLCAGFVVAGLYLIAPNLSNVWLFVGTMIAISLSIDFGLGATWASYQDIAGRHVASVLGVGNMCGNLGAALFGWLIGLLADADRWNTVFLLSAIAMTTLAICWLFFDASRVISREAGKAG